MEILCVLMGMFAGVAAAGYMFIQPLAERDKTIAEQKEENLQVCNENKDLRAELEDLSFDLSVANRKIEQKDEIVKEMQVKLCDFDTKQAKLSKIKELVDDYQSIN